MGVTKQVVSGMVENSKYSFPHQEFVFCYVGGYVLFYMKVFEFYQMDFLYLLKPFYDYLPLIV